MKKNWNHTSQLRPGYDSLRRRVALTNLTLGIVHNYGYDAASRLQSVSTGDGGALAAASYGYLTNSPLAGSVTFQRNGATAMTVKKTYDFLNRLGATTNSAAATVASAYAYNLANHRTAVTNADGSRWAFGYDGLGQVTNGWRYWADSSEVSGQVFNYAFDDIGNRKNASSGSSGALRVQTYVANSLNQYTNRTVPGFIEANGTADAAASVTVNGTAASRHADYFRGEVSVNNASAAVVQWVTNRGTLSGTTSSVSRVAYVPLTPETNTFDADGNLTLDGLWSYTWDGENRLGRIETRTNAITANEYWHRLDLTYDHMGRRVRKQVSGGLSTGGWTLLRAQRFFYDGWNLIGQVDEVTGTRLSFIWGSDLSGSLQGAGGVGGLLALVVHNGGLAGTYFYGYDGNGNVAVLMNAADGTEAARYEYGPFGELLRTSGPLAKLNPFRFSTKYQDDETGLLYYGYRYLSTMTGRWLGRDPIGEEGGLNIFGDCNNDCLNQTDLLGLATPMPPPPVPTPAFDITAIPGIMTANGWVNAAALQKRWFANAATGPQLPDTTTIKMKWVLGYPRAKKVYDEIINQKLYLNPAAIAQIKKTHGNKNGKFGDFSLPVPTLDKEYIQYRAVGSINDDVDDLFGALGKFTFRVVVKGCATKGAIGITHIGIYVRDSFDFQGEQGLGFWNKATNYGGGNPFKGTRVSNSDYRAYAKKTGFGGDFLVYSDLVIIKLTPHEVILK